VATIAWHARRIETERSSELPQLLPGAPADGDWRMAAQRSLIDVARDAVTRRLHFSEEKT
jgi:hypothetical protein